MDVVLAVLVALNLVFSVVVLIVVLARRASTASSGGLSAELSAQRSEMLNLLTSDREERRASHRELRTDLGTAHTQLVQWVQYDGETARTAAEALRVNVTGQLEAVRTESETKLDKVRESVDSLTTSNITKLTELQTLLREELERLRTGNEAKLEKMRETVDEKLQGTLERRLGESFALVSSRLEEVQKGLGEMQNLASDVGGLKRVLTNVKNRGGWGEVQLSRQLEDILTPEQYAENVAVRPGSAERVEFAVKLPGRDDDGTVVYLPIDSKFPQEDYERLLDAQETGDKTVIDDIGRALERAIVEQAKTIARKYIEAPHTTDFAILYVPTEGLFAEVIRRPGLASRLQTEQRVIVAGPTTLMSLLNSLQMGFRTLAIERRSSEVWKVLGAAKTEFKKYGEVWAKLEKQLQTAQNTVTEAGRRTRAVERRLRDVEEIDSPATQLIPALDERRDETTERDDATAAEQEEAALPSEQSA